MIIPISRRLNNYVLMENLYDKIRSSFYVVKEVFNLSTCEMWLETTIEIIHRCEFFKSIDIYL